ncbi:ComEA family DNA-binding protein [Psychrobacter sp. JB385]|uniref:ComEA family DNA-binding protein n=1 Tax=Psychrobacter sp. JB385 TaxID=1434841 RepID=UPI00097E7CE1|nr:ComEA family DNA-binding protein [Psychrobacter sp. JB385]SJN43020.1 Late competence protein ComEA, DNA receptor [Psychrobacter sp. JB385]
MNAYSKNSFIGWIVRAGGCVLLSMIMLSNAIAAPCFKDPQRAYEYLLAQEKSAIQARDQKIIDINRANEGELTSLHGIGSSKAQAIILYRDMFGNFKTVDELANVKGIGAKTIEKNRARLRV